MNPSPLDRKKTVFLRFEFEISATILESVSTKNDYLFFSNNIKVNLKDFDNIINNLLLFSDSTRKFGE